MNLDRTTKRRLAVLACGTWLLVGSTAGCSGLARSESQLFGGTSSCESASITYRIVRDFPRSEPSGPALLNFLTAGGSSREPERRITTLAIRYPHPAGRAGFARVECVVRIAPQGDVSSATLPSWLERAREMADDGLPGLTLADGIHEAMGLDVPIGDLEYVLAALRQPPNPSATPAGASGAGLTVQLAGTIDGAASLLRSGRVAELDELIGHVRREGKLISHTTRIVEPMFDLGGSAIAARSPRPTGEDHQSVQPVTRVSYESSPVDPVVASGTREPTVRRLPPVNGAAQ